MGDMTFRCKLCGQRMVIDMAGAGLIITCPGCGARIQVPMDWTTESQTTKRPLAEEWAFRKRLETRPIGKLYDESGRFWGRGFQELSDKLMQLGLIKRGDDGFYFDKSHPLYLPPTEAARQS
jgi:DNA-directed RNA polymerase subunit RPC12/RpoP